MAGEADADAALMAAFRGGDERAFRSLYERYARAMIAFCQRFVRESARAEELAQDVFVKLYRARDRYEPRAPFRPFLYRIATNHCLNELRRGEHGRDAGDPVDPDALPSAGADPGRQAEQAALERAVEGALAALPEKQRLAFVLCRFQGLTYEEIAEALGTSTSAVKALIHRATVAAAEALRPFAPDGTGGGS